MTPAAASRLGPGPVYFRRRVQLRLWHVAALVLLAAGAFLHGGSRKSPASRDGGEVAKTLSVIGTGVCAGDADDAAGFDELLDEIEPSFDLPELDPPAPDPSFTDSGDGLA